MTTRRGEVSVPTLGLAVLFILGCFIPRSAVPPDSPAVLVADSARTAALTFLLRRPAWTPRIFCVALHESGDNPRNAVRRDPPPWMLETIAKALEDSTVSLRPASECLRQLAPLPGAGAVTDARTGTLAMDYWAGVARPDSGARVRVDAGYWCGGRCAGWYTCIVQREGSEWVALRCDLNEIAMRPQPPGSLTG